MSRYCLTGATGFIGGRLARRLRAAGHAVSALVRDPARAPGLAALGVELHRGDVTEPATLPPAMRGADGVFHLAAWYRLGRRGRESAARVNVDGTRHVLEAMRDLGIPRGVYTSTLAIHSDTRGRIVDESHVHHGPFLSEYERTKWRAHHEVALPMMRAGLPLVIAVSGVVYGPGDTSMLHATLVQYLTRRLPMAPRGTAYCWAHVDDVADAHLLALERGAPGETYIVAGPPHTLVEALEIAERITGIPAPRLRPPPAVVRALAAVMGGIERVVPLPETLSGEGLRAVAGATYLGSNARARSALGWEPRTLEDGLRETLLHEMRSLGIAAPPS